MSAKTISRVELMNILCEQMGLEKKKSSEILELILQTMLECFADGLSIKIPGFGTFLVRDKTSRPGRNPRTGKDKEIEARRIVALRPSPLLKKALEN